MPKNILPWFLKSKSYPTFVFLPLRISPECQAHESEPISRFITWYACQFSETDKQLQSNSNITASSTHQFQFNSIPSCNYTAFPWPASVHLHILATEFDSTTTTSITQQHCHSNHQIQLAIFSNHAQVSIAIQTFNTITHFRRPQQLHLYMNS